MAVLSHGFVPEVLEVLSHGLVLELPEELSHGFLPELPAELLEVFFRGLVPEELAVLSVLLEEPILLLLSHLPGKGNDQQSQRERDYLKNASGRKVSA